MPAQEWLTLQEASRRLGVHPATLRHWADKGKIHAYRTPGGHRRFSATDVEALISAREEPSPAREVEVWVQAALGRARMQVTAGELGHELWLRQVSDAARRRYRALGRELLRLLAEHLSVLPGSSRALEDAEDIGRQYGMEAARDGMSPAVLVRAFLSFREHLVETMLRVPSNWHERVAGGVPQWHQRMTEFTSRVLLGALEGWESVQQAAGGAEVNEGGGSGD